MPQEKTHNTRVRENQRRSRARRKDYLQEVEAKLRQCELHGVEASSEIQLAARKVADENKRLRELLVLNGVSNEDIAACAYSGSPSPVIDGQSALEKGAVDALEQLLVEKRCCPKKPSSTDCNGDSDSNGASSLRPSPVEQAIQPAPIFSRSSCRKSSPARIMPQPLLPRSQPPVQPGLHLGQPLETPSYQPSYNEPVSSYPQTGNYSEYNAPIAANSCIFATDMITTMAGGDPLVVREELGCLPGMDCEVDNALVFNVMGRYTDIAAVGS